ncbi:hypothetical protein WG907_05280 [Sphingobium sp. AN558]|uniref:hypothetical protein n=1 Tax=Sphingobium sp. AN558 TaxID=3133442 RepID=UPI0030C041E6
MYSFYMEARDLYRLRLYHGGTLYKEIENFGPSVIEGPTGPANSSYATTSDLASALTSNLSAILAEPGKAGTFTVREYADFAEAVAADTEQVNFIRSAGTPSQVWVRTSILSFGAGQTGFDAQSPYISGTVGDRLTKEVWLTDLPYDASIDGSDITTELQQAINKGATRVVIPSKSAGTLYTVSDTIEGSNYVEVAAHGKYPTAIRGLVNNIPILYGDGLEYFKTSGLHLQYDGTPVEGADAVWLNNCFQCDVDIVNLGAWNAVLLTGGKECRVGLDAFGWESSAIRLDAAIDTVIYRATGSALDRPGAGGSLRLHGGVEGLEANDLKLTLGKHGLVLTGIGGSSARGLSPWFNTIIGGFFDSTAEQVALLQQGFQLEMIATWLASAGHDPADVGFTSMANFAGLEVMPGFSQLDYQGGKIYGNGGAGVIIHNDAGRRGINLDGTLVERNQRSRSVDGPGILVKAGTQGFSLLNIKGERDADTATYRQTEAVRIEAGASDHYNASVLTNSLTVFDGGTGTDKEVSINYAGPNARKTDLAATTATKGVGMIGMDPASSYAPASAGFYIKRILNREVRMSEQSGADPTGSADSTAAIVAALGIAGMGARLIWGVGNYKWSSVTLPDGGRIIADGEVNSIATCSSTTGKITVGADGLIEGLKLVGNGGRTAGNPLVHLLGNGARVAHSAFATYSLAVQAGILGGTLTVDPCVEDCAFRSPLIGTDFGSVYFSNFANGTVKDVVATGPASGTQPDWGFRAHNGDTLHSRGNNWTRLGNALLLDVPAGYNLFAPTFVGDKFDSAGTITGGASVNSARITPAGAIYSMQFSAPWFGLSAGASGCFVSTSGAGVVDGLYFSIPVFPGNADCGLIVDGVGVKNWGVFGGSSSGNVNHGIRAAGATSHFNITGHIAGAEGGRGPNGRGITVDTGASDWYNITGGSVDGNTVYGLFDGGTGTNARVTDVAGYNPGTIAALTPGASPWTYTNSHSPRTVYIFGSGITDIKHNGSTVFPSGTAQASLELGPNEDFTIAYSGAAPTVTAKRH